MTPKALPLKGQVQILLGNIIPFERRGFYSIRTFLLQFDSVSLKWHNYNRNPYKKFTKAMIIECEINLILVKNKLVISFNKVN